MSVQIKGSGTIGGIDEGLNITGIVTATSFVGSGANLTGITQTTINNNANNRIITGSGTANTLNGESGLTYDGNDLTITGAIPSLKFTESDGNPDYQLLSNNGIFKIHDVTNSVDRLTVASDGKIKFATNNSTTDYLQWGANPRLWLRCPSNMNGLRIDASTTPVEIRNSDATGRQISVGGAPNSDISISGDYSLSSGGYDSSPRIYLNATRHNGSSTVTSFQTSIQAVATSNTNNTGYLGFGGSASPDDLVILTSGKVGINSITPAEMIDVRGTSLSNKFTARSHPVSSYTTSTAGYKFGARGSYALSVGGSRSGNSSSFTMFELRDFNNSKYFDIEISFAHAGGGIHGSYRRMAGICNGYTSIQTWNDTGNVNVGGGSGFTISKPDVHTLRVVWNGASSYADHYTLYCLIHASYSGTYFSYYDSAFY